MTLAFGIASAGTACVIVIRPTATDAYWLLLLTVELLFLFTSYFPSLFYTNTRWMPKSVREGVQCCGLYDSSSINLSSEAAALVSWQIFTTLPPLQRSDGSDKGAIWQLDFNGAFKGYKEAESPLRGWLMLLSCLKRWVTETSGGLERRSRKERLALVI